MFESPLQRALSRFNSNQATEWDYVNELTARMDVLENFAGLSDNYRCALLLKEGHGLTVEKTATLMESSTASLRSIPTGPGKLCAGSPADRRAQQIVPYNLARNDRGGTIKIAVLASGSGTNLQALIDAEDLGAEIVVLIVDHSGIGAIDRAKAAGIPVELVEYSDFEDRDSFSAAVADAAARAGADALVLAGFMRILSPVAIARFPQRIINIHPSLLPAFPGAHAIAQALAHGVKLTGVTVHFVDEEVDHGPIIAQRPVPLLNGDTEKTLHERIQVEEHKLYPEVVAAFAAGDISVLGREVIWR